MRSVLSDYVKSFDPRTQAWSKRVEAGNFASALAGNFASALAAELRLNPKAVQVENDSRLYRVHMPLLRVYWSPISNEPGDWEREFDNISKEIREWARSQ